MEWYALFVKTGKEDNVQEWLQYHFEASELYSFVPKRKLLEKRGGISSHTTRPIFPGYVLIKTDMSEHAYYKIKDIPNLYKVIHNGSDFSKIENYEIEPILKLVGKKDVIDLSEVCFEDAKVRVINGPLLGMEGIVKKINKHTKRAKILLDFLGNQRLVDVGIEILYVNQ